MSVLQYAIQVLQVEHVIVCGHYGCGAVQAVINQSRFGLIDYWLSSIRRVHDKYETAIDRLSTSDEKSDRLCELNVLEQARHVCQTDIVQDTWRAQKSLTVHGWIYRLTDGRLHSLQFCVASNDELQKVTHDLVLG